MKKRTLAMLLTLLLVVSIVPVAAMAKETCEHKHLKWVAKDPETHIQQCSDCWNYVVEDSVRPHTFADGKCVVCDYPAPGETLPKETEPEETEPEVTECTHVAKAGTYIRNAFESHTAICEKCGEEFTEHCVFGEDHKCVCGNSNLSYPDATEPEETEPEETEPEETKPEETTPSQPSGKDENLDDVPATGDNGAVVVYVSMTVLAMFGVACLLNKKRVF